MIYRKVGIRRMFTATPRGREVIGSKRTKRAAACVCSVILLTASALRS
jgi:hypothetical protein